MPKPQMLNASLLPICKFRWMNKLQTVSLLITPQFSCSQFMFIPVHTDQFQAMYRVLNAFSLLNALLSEKLTRLTDCAQADIGNSHPFWWHTAHSRPPATLAR